MRTRSWKVAVGGASVALIMVEVASAGVSPVAKPDME
jgi:hypothetical protein